MSNCQWLQSTFRFACIDTSMPVWVRVDAVQAVYGDVNGKTHVSFFDDNEIVVDTMADDVIEALCKGPA